MLNALQTFQNIASDDSGDDECYQSYAEEMAPKVFEIDDYESPCKASSEDEAKKPNEHSTPQMRTIENFGTPDRTNIGNEAFKAAVDAY